MMLIEESDLHEHRICLLANVFWVSIQKFKLLTSTKSINFAIRILSVHSKNNIY